MLPPLDGGLEGWTVEKDRASHVNARRLHGGREFHLKWFRHGVLGNPGRAEWRNAARIAALGLPTVVATGWGRHPGGSFVVLEGSPGRPGDAWIRSGVGGKALRSVTRELAAGVARMHDANLCHRDLNVYHVLVDGCAFRLIDVGRVMRFVRRRWIVKDLASLLHSTPSRVTTGVMRSTVMRTVRSGASAEILWRSPSTSAPATLKSMR